MGKTKKKMTTPTFSKAMMRLRGRAIKRYYRNHYESAVAKKDPKDRYSLMAKISSYCSMMDRIGLEDLEAFLSFVGASVDAEDISNWVDILKIEDLMNSLKTPEKAMAKATQP